MLLLLLAACSLKDGRAGVVNGTLGDSGGLTSPTPSDTAPPASPSSTCIEGAGITFTPTPVPAAAPLTVAVTAATAYTWVGLSVEGPDTALVGEVERSGTGPWTWTAVVDGLVEGAWEVTFTADSGALVVCAADVPVYTAR